MKKLLLLFFAGFSVVACAQKSWYKMLSGTIDKFPVTLHLHNAGHNYYGYYYYTSQQKPIYFNGEDTSVKGKITLVAFTSNEYPETFSITSTGNGLSGSWKKDEKSKPLLFAATEMQTAVPFTYVYSQGEKKLRPQLKQTPMATFLAGSIWPAGASPLDAFLKKSILQIYRQKISYQEIGQAMLQTKNQFFKEYETDNKDVKPADLKEYPESYNYDITEQIMMVYQSPKLATISHFTYVYSGGAHGNYGTSYHVFDLQGKKALKLAEVLTLEGRKKLPALLEKAVRAQYKLKPADPLTDVLFEEKIAPNDNFYITGKGLGFNYNPYEIAAYAVGEINLFLTFKELELYLQPSFKSLLQ